MSIQVSSARGAEEFPNPLAVANLIHYAVAAVAGGVGMWLGVAATQGGAIDAAGLFAAFFLIFVAMVHGAWAWRYSYFSIAPEHVQPLQGDGQKQPAAYVHDLITHGIPLLGPVDGALANRLLKRMPGLRHAPRFIQVFAVAQWERMLLGAAILASFMAAMVLTWGEPLQPMVAWFYLLLVGLRVFRPWSVIRRLLTLNPESQPVLGTQVKRSDIFLLVVLAVAPLAARVLAGIDAAALGDFRFSPLLVWSTLALLVTAVGTGVLSYLALVAQTRDLERSKADFIRIDLPSRKADMRHAFRRLDTFLHSFIGPASVHGLPPKSLVNPVDPELPATQGTGKFRGLRFLESAPRASAGKGDVPVAERISQALANPRERPVLVLGVAGAVLLFAFAGMLAWFTGAVGTFESPLDYVAVATVMVGFLAAGESAFAAAHLLWQRFDFVSEVLMVDVQGEYTVDQQVLRDQLTAQTGVIRTGSETTSTIHHVSGTHLAVSHFVVHSTCYTLGSVRTATSVVPKADTHRLIAQVLDESIGEAHEARKATLRGEGELKAAYDGQRALADSSGQAGDMASASPALRAPAEE